MRGRGSIAAPTQTELPILDHYRIDIFEVIIRLPLRRQRQIPDNHAISSVTRHHQYTNPAKVRATTTIGNSRLLLSIASEVTIDRLLRVYLEVLSMIAGLACPGQEIMHIPGTRN